eukprot:7396667-Lingulodinium_polyedra.AAC.1
MVCPPQDLLADQSLPLGVVADTSSLGSGLCVPEDLEPVFDHFGPKPPEHGLGLGSHVRGDLSKAIGLGHSEHGQDHWVGEAGLGQDGHEAA